MKEIRSVRCHGGGKRVRILHVLHSLQVGGLENGVVNLINNLASDRFEHVLCCITSSGPMANRLGRPVQIYELNKGEEADPFLSLKIGRVVRTVRPDIVHTRNWGTIDGVIGAFLGGTRRVVHGEHGREATDPLGANRKRLLIRRFLSPFISSFVPVSSDLRDWLVNEVGVRTGKVAQIINGVDTERYLPPADKAIAKSDLGIDPDTFVVGTVGRLDPVKNQQLLLRAFAEIMREKSVAVTKRPVLMVVGGGPGEHALRQLAADLGITGSVYFAGEQRDVPNHLRAMDLFVLPSIAEGISNTILEAMSTALPVIASNVGGNAELVEDGVTGNILPDLDKDTLAEQIVRYASDSVLLNTFGIASRKRCLENFSLAAMVDRYDRLYSDLYWKTKES